MPKKRTPVYTQTKPNYVHPSLQSSRSSAAALSSPTTPQTVNERIQQLRREAAPRTTTERRDEITEVVTQRTAPPEIRRILHMAELDAPSPKPGSSRSMRASRQGARPPPGPAAPSSWLHASIHAPAHIRKANVRNSELDRPSKFCHLANVNDEEFKRLPPPRSLVHHCLKTFALHWEELAEYEQHYLPTLPVALKETLLSYLTLYGGKDCLDLSTFKILFGNSDEVDADSGMESVHFLDFTGLLNPDYTLRDLEKSLTHSFNKFDTGESIASLKLNDTQSNHQSDEIADSWEDEVDSTAPLPRTLNIPIFTNLTRLSLAHAGSTASWADLLSLSKKLNTLTHLSLAYWPIPSMTPNATTTSMVSKGHRPVAMGGRHFYSTLDDDWAEAANVLRRLSHNTYCLKWLDLEGCKWHKALTWDYPEKPVSRTPAGATSAAVWVRPSVASPGPDWAGAWRQISYLNLFQGWIPTDSQSLVSLPAGTTAVQLLGWLREHKNDPRYQDKLKAGAPPGCSVLGWLNGEKMAKTVGSEIMKQRKAKRAGAYCFVDHGWEPIVLTGTGTKKKKKEGEGGEGAVGNN
ncbi:hypothetical protein BU24DRAFT_423561 [Aaosphaeria arxii CBS 175.79]|uniref:Tafazzin n=1 Tax=Aaosphaeria arxii CBS 175.79 TaxID=1450172 RepID=A0A6A5XN41_9PLEO|nr:uncharacterized protein BU24DRAFT_423561 [Aaosphaeria arxii CBS 175.79]KAF2014658.1 hypothetical protein BU24DRAFT_423561 [Aaosphaeria arxii CBS 175.79]